MAGLFDPANCSAVLRVLGVGFSVAFGNALALLFSQFHLAGGVAQHHQAANDRAYCNDQNQPGIPGHRVLLEGIPAGEEFRPSSCRTTSSDSVSQWFHCRPGWPGWPLPHHLPRAPHPQKRGVRCPAPLSSRSTSRRLVHRRAIARSVGSRRNRQP